MAQRKNKCFFIDCIRRLLLYEALGLYYAFRSHLDEIGANGQLAYVDVEAFPINRLAHQQVANDVVNLIVVHGDIAFHLEEFAGGIGEDVECCCGILVDAPGGVVLSDEEDVVNVDHELVGAVVMNDGHVDVLSLVFSEVNVILIPVADLFGGHVNIPNDGECSRVVAHSS